MEVEITEFDGTTLVVPCGRLDGSRVTEFSTSLKDLITERGVCKLAVSLREVHFTSEDFWRQLNAAIQKTYRGRTGDNFRVRVRVCGITSAAVMQTFRRVGTRLNIPYFPTEAEAISTAW